jgi:hypothetical protein
MIMTNSRFLTLNSGAALLLLSVATGCGDSGTDDGSGGSESGGNGNASGGSGSESGGSGSESGGSGNASGGSRLTADLADKTVALVEQAAIAARRRWILDPLRTS